LLALIRFIEIFPELKKKKLLLKTSDFSRFKELKIFELDFLTDTRFTELPRKLFCFFALKGKTLDGHDFIELALQKEASFIFLEKPRIFYDLKDKFTKTTFVLVRNTLEIYQIMANFYLKSLPNLRKTIAITGSNGKTTFKELLAGLLEKKFIVVKTNLNENNEIGVPKTIFRANQKTEVLILEFGMRGLGQIKKLTQIAEPDYEIITNIGSAHLEILKTKGKIAQAKAEIFYFNPKKDAKALFPKDQRKKILTWINKIKQKKPNKIFLEIESPQIKDSQISSEGQEITYFEYKKNSYKFPSLKEELIQLVCLGIEIAKDLKLSNSEIQTGLLEFSAPEKRGSLKKINNNLLVFDETYNASIESVLVLANYLASYQKILSKNSSEKIETILVIGEILELGKDFECLVKRCIFLSKKLVNQIILVGERYKFLSKLAEVVFFEKKEELILSKQFEEKNKIYLIGLKASRAKKFETLLGEKT